MVSTAVDLALDLDGPGLDLLGSPWLLKETWATQQVDTPALYTLLELEGLDAAGVFVDRVFWPGADWSLEVVLVRVRGSLRVCRGTIMLLSAPGYGSGKQFLAPEDFHAKNENKFSETRLSAKVSHLVVLLLNIDETSCLNAATHMSVVIKWLSSSFSSLHELATHGMDSSIIW